MLTLTIPADSPPRPQVMESGEQMNIKVPRGTQGEVRSVAKCSFCNETLFVAQPMVVMHCPGREDNCDRTCRPAEACPAIDSALHVACAVWLDRSALKGGTDGIQCLAGHLLPDKVDDLASRLAARQCNLVSLYAENG